MAETEKSLHTQLQQSWIANADGWTKAVREGKIESRKRGTDAAILEAVSQKNPQRILDLGCGEGWLSHALAKRGFEVTGIDASEPLIEAARASAGNFQVLSYEDLIDQPQKLGTFDAIICNFSLLADDLEQLLKALKQSLNAEAHLFIQTVHPLMIEPYQDGWRTETFAGFGEGFNTPMPWYFRTLKSWFSALKKTGYQLDEVLEPRAESSEQPLSLLLICSRKPD